MPTITQCPPHAAHLIEAPEPQFQRIALPFIPSEMDGTGEMHSPTNLSFDDIGRCQIKVRKPAPRQKPIPEYALDNNNMRAVLVRFMERRAFGNTVEGRRPMPGSDAQRLRRATAKMLGDRPRLISLIGKLSAEYVEGKNNGASPERLRELESEIENTDSQLRLMQNNFPAIVLSVMYRSYRLCEDSVTVAQALNLKPPAVRQLLHRLAQTWKLMQTESAPPTVCGRLPKTPLKRLERTRKSAARWYANLTPEQKESPAGQNQRVPALAVRRKTERLGVARGA
jgi:hypothetical protein